MNKENTTTKQIICDLRYGLRNIVDFTDEELENLIDYNLPEDVMYLCFADIKRRREERLSKQQEK